MSMTKEELKKAKRKAYDARPEVKARRKAHANKPDVKARTVEYMVEYQRKYQREVVGRKPRGPAMSEEEVKQRKTDYTHRVNTQLTEIDTLPVDKAYKLLVSRMKRLISTNKGNARKRGLEHSITYDDLLDIYATQEGKCALTGRALVLAKNSRDTISIDRIDSTIGYIKSNIHLVTWQVNAAKNVWSTADLIALAEAIVTHSKPL